MQIIADKLGVSKEDITESDAKHRTMQIYKGLGTPATRADIIEKLVKDGFVKREKKQMIPTEDGMKLITVLPDVVKSPKLTADWAMPLCWWL